MADDNLLNNFSLSGHGGTVSQDTIAPMADVDAKEAVVTFGGVAILTPRGEYNVELHLSFLRLRGQADDFKIQYSNIVRLFSLPKSNEPHRFVVITLDPPICEGATLYPHIVMQFENDCVIESTLSISGELLNTTFKDKLEPSYKGLIHRVFTNILRALSSAKVTRPGRFRNSQDDGYAVMSSSKGEDGILYPLEKSFFFLPKPPTLILYEEIDYVEIHRHAVDGLHYFDLVVRLRSKQEHLFRNIQRIEYYNLITFISSKSLKILNFSAEPVDPHLNRIQTLAEDGSHEVDEDFVSDEDDEGSPADESGEDDDDDDDASDSDSDGEQESVLIKPRPMSTAFVLFSQAERENIKKENPAVCFFDMARTIGEKWRRMSAAEKVPYESEERAVKERYIDEIHRYNNQQSANVESGNDTDVMPSKDGDEDGSRKRKLKKRKNPDAPKCIRSAFILFCEAERENIKKENPNLFLTDIMKILGEKWRNMSAAEKEPYEAEELADKKRYIDEMRGYAYNHQKSANVESGNDSDSN